jgi:hypothetical protein
MSQCYGAIRFSNSPLNSAKLLCCVKNPGGSRFDLRQRSSRPRRSTDRSYETILRPALLARVSRTSLSATAT